MQAFLIQFPSIQNSNGYNSAGNVAVPDKSAWHHTRRSSWILRFVFSASEIYHERFLNNSPPGICNAMIFLWTNYFCHPLFILFSELLTGILNTRFRLMVLLNNFVLWTIINFISKFQDLWTTCWSAWLCLFTSLLQFEISWLIEAKFFINKILALVHLNFERSTYSEFSEKYSV